jgi:hypothetical protein
MKLGKSIRRIIDEAPAQRSVVIVLDTSRKVGGCNGCNEHITSDGVAEHDVAVIQLRVSSVRLCRECTKLLSVSLRNIDW